MEMEMEMDAHAHAEAHRPSVAERRASFMKEAFSDMTKIEEQPFTSKNLRPCQVDKLTALFEKYYDVDKDGYLSANDVEALNEKIFDYTGWNRDDVTAKKLIEYHNDLFKCILMEVNSDAFSEEQKVSEVSLNAWLTMWDRAMHRALAIIHLPQWVQVLPYNMYSIIDKYGRGHITKQNLFEFYTDFMGLDDKRGKIVSENAWSQMTGNGDFKLTLDVYTMAFSNFLFAKNIYGPGLYILGTFEDCHKPTPYKIVLPNISE